MYADFEEANVIAEVAALRKYADNTRWDVISAAIERLNFEAFEKTGNLNFGICINFD